MLLEKSKNTVEFIKNVEEILKTSDYKNLEKIKDIIRYKAEGIIKQEQLETILNKVKIKKEEKTMTLAERIHENERKERLEIKLQAIEEGKIEGILQGKIEGKMEGKKEGKREGKREGIIQGEIRAKLKTIRKMLGLKLDDKIIQEVTGVKKKELEKIKKELEEAKS